MTDEIRLVIPAEQDFHGVARLVLGGVAARLDLSYEQLEDLQTALEALLRLRDDEDEIAVALRVAAEALHVSVGPFEAAAVAELDAEETGIGLQRLLETVCDTFETDGRDGGVWVDLTKRTGDRAGAAG